MELRQEIGDRYGMVRSDERGDGLAGDMACGRLIVITERLIGHRSRLTIDVAFDEFEPLVGPE